VGCVLRHAGETLSVRHLADKYATILDRLMRDQVSPEDLRIAKMEGAEAAYESAQARNRNRGLKSWSRRQSGNG
jgi:hypothetical protein